MIRRHARRRFNLAAAGAAMRFARRRTDRTLVRLRPPWRAVALRWRRGVVRRAARTPDSRIVAGHSAWLPQFHLHFGVAADLHSTRAPHAIRFHSSDGHPAIRFLRTEPRTTAAARYSSNGAPVFPRISAAPLTWPEHTPRRRIPAILAERGAAKAKRRSEVSLALAPPSHHFARMVRAPAPIARGRSWSATGAAVAMRYPRAAANVWEVTRESPAVPRWARVPAPDFVWRKGGVAPVDDFAESASGRTGMSAGGARAVSASAATPALAGPPVKAEATPIAVLDPSLVDRIAEDVVRRVERRVRIERERRGI